MSLGLCRLPLAVATLAIGVLLGLGAILAWLRTRSEAATAGSRRLAVLPFARLGWPNGSPGYSLEIRLIAIPTDSMAPLP
jgi:hypothetical protein